MEFLNCFNSLFRTLVEGNYNAFVPLGMLCINTELFAGFAWSWSAEAIAQSAVSDTIKTASTGCSLFLRFDDVLVRG